MLPVGVRPQLADNAPDSEISERVCACRANAGGLSRSSRELPKRLGRRRGDVSHVTISESIREMRNEGVFRETIVPNEELFNFALFEFKFNPEHFADSGTTRRVKTGRSEAVLLPASGDFIHFGRMRPGCAIPRITTSTWNTAM